MMRTFGRNKQFIEGSIKELYEIDEAMKYVMEFIPNGKEKCYKKGRKVSMENEVYEGPRPLNSQGKIYDLTLVQYEQVRKWVLRHSSENTEWEEKYEIYLQSFNRTRIGRNTALEYIPWLGGQLRGTLMTDFKRLANGPSFTTISYISYWVNGYLFYTAESEKHLTTQNSGVDMNAKC